MLKKSLVTVIIIIAVSFKSYCQSVYYYAPTQSSIICPNAEYQYDAVPGGIIEGAYNECSILDNFHWSVVGGTIVSNNNSFITVIWDSNNGFKSITLTTKYYIPVLPGPIQCVDAGSTFDHIETTYPTLVTLNISGSSNTTTYCIDSSINLTGTSGFTSYKWQYSIQTEVWNTFSTTTTSSIAFGIQDIFGASYSAYLGQSIFFRYSVDNCDPNQTASPPIGAYKFGNNALKVIVSAVAKNEISCVGSASGSITIPVVDASFNRVLLPSENIVSTSLYTQKNLTSFYKSSSGNSVSGIEPGTYYILVESNIIPCSIASFSEAVTFSNPTALSATAAVTSNYNGKQISCSTASDGAIAVTASGGTGALQYKINSGSYQSSNVFSGLGAGNYTIGVKDNNGCILSLATPVQVSSPSAVVVSSFTKTDALCNGGKGSITISGSGGADGFGYEYSKDGGGSYQAENVFSNLAAGIYQMRVKDKNGCFSSVQNIEISQPPTINFTSVDKINPQCFGISDGSITINGASGSGNTIQFSKDGTTFQSSNVFGSLAAGTYTIYAKDGNCPSVILTSITLDQPVSVGISSTSFVEPTCFGRSDGSITVTSSTATQYSINAGTTFQTSNTFNTNISSGNYSVMVKDAKGCQSAIEVIQVTEPSPITATISQIASIQCYGQPTELSVTPSGGTAPYTYAWSNGVSTQTNANIPAGNYSVAITDSKTCTGTGNITVTQPAALVVTPSFSNISCKGGTNGSINLVVSGGTGSKTYSWSNGASTQNLSGLLTGIYSVAVTDANGCINNTTSVTITEPETSVSVSLQSKTNVTCFNGSNGSILVTASGGTGTLTYSKDGTNFQAGANFTGLAPGNYVITAKDANNCIQTTSSISITQPSAALSIAGIVRNNPLCNGNANGSLSVSATGGTPPYLYSIDGTNFSSSTTIGGLIAGNYLVTVKDANNCTAVSASQPLANPALLTATVTASPQSCATVVDGRLSVSAGGGTGTLQYSIDGTNFQTSSIFNGLLAGSYTVTIKDANNCLITRPATITNVAAITGTIAQTSFINCFGQSTAALNVSVLGGTAPFTYAWSNSATTQSISSLAAGNFSVGITDSKGCTGSANFTVAQPSALAASTTVSNYNGFGVTCNGAATGFLNLTVVGGTSPFTYAWSNGATIKDVSSLAAGTYSVTVTDSKGCTAAASATLSTPPVVGISLGSKINVTCNGGSNGLIVVNAAGGAGTFNYSINGVNWQGSNSFGLLTQGAYTLRARDQNNCVSPSPLAVSITQPSVISISFTGFQNANCGAADGAVQAVASGGTGALSYQWKDQANNIIGNAATLSNVISGSFTVTVTDQSSCARTSGTSVGANGGAVFAVASIVSTSCFSSTDGKAQVSISSGLSPFIITWDSGETGASAIQLPGGSNSVTVKDAANCSVSANFTVPSPDAISLSAVTPTSPDCVGGSNGSIQVTATGGTGGYSYQWDGTIGTNILSGIASGTYTVQIIDSKNCSFSHAIALNDVAAITISTVNQIPPSCASSTDGSIQVSASGGNGAFTYLWNTGATVASVNGLTAGTYTVTAIDAKACTHVKSIPLEAPPELSLSLVNASQVSCFGGSNGSATLAASGGVGMYQYSINEGATWQTSATFNNLLAGNIDAATRDANGCIGTTSITITQPSLLVTDVSATVNTTCGLANGSATASGSGGTAPYTYQWFNSANQGIASSNILQNAGADNYQLVTTDANSCTVVSTVTIAPSANVSFSITNVAATKCPTSSDGSAQLVSVTGTAPFTYLWSSGETAVVATQLITGINTVKVTDANGCFLQQTFSVSSPSAISLISETVFPPLCAGGNGSIQVTATGGISPYTFNWNDQPGTSLLQDIKAGSYQLEVKDANGCVLRKPFSMTDPPVLKVDLGPDKKICTGGTLTLSSPADATAYLWTSQTGFSSTGKQVTINQAGVYTLRLTDSNGCVAEDSFVLTTTNDLLKADFLMSSVAHIGDTVVVIDISWPLPERIEWFLPKEATVLLQSQDYASLVFNTEGKFPVKLAAKLGECQSEYVSTVEILKKSSKGGRIASANLITLLEVFPNPSAQGFVTVKVALGEVTPIRARLVSLEGNAIVADFYDSGKGTYEFEMRWEGISKGVYFLIVDVKDQKRVVRIVII